MTKIDYRVWQTPELAKMFLENLGGARFAMDMHLEATVRVLRGLERPVKRVVDIGCGDGLLARTALAAFPEAEAVLVDFSAPMLAAARECMAEYADRMIIVEADFAHPAWVQALPAGALYDAVLSGRAIHHQPDARKLAVYREIHDLLAPGGVFIHLEHVGSESPWLSSIWADAYIDYSWAQMRSKDPAYTRQQATDAYAAREDMAANLLVPVEPQMQWLRDIGYTDVACWSKFLELATFGGRKAK
jgi:tRNA (cmo5U34)-methyltransferase